VDYAGKNFTNHCGYCLVSANFFLWVGVETSVLNNLSFLHELLLILEEVSNA